MDKKDILMVIVIAAVVGVVASLITTNVSGDASLSPPRIIEAHACNADGVCEGNEFSGDFISGSWGQIQRYPASYGDGLLMRSEHSEPIHFRTPSDGHPVGFNDVTIDVDGKLIVRNLEGKGTGYACVKSDGTIFRSEIPCSAFE